MERNMFVYKDNFGDDNKVALVLNMYRDNNNLYVGFEEYDEEFDFWSPFCDVTVNIRSLPYLESAINIELGGQEKIDFLTKNGFGELTDKKLRSGFLEFPVFRFNAEKLKELDPDFFAKYAVAQGRDFDGIYFDDQYISEEYGTTTYYFVAPKELLEGDYPEAECMEISIEFPTNQPEARYAGVSCSPTMYDEEEEGYVDYDWYDVNMPDEQIEKLMSMAEKEIERRKTVSLEQRIADAKTLSSEREDGKQQCKKAEKEDLACE